jgi:hypothetical protein
MRKSSAAILLACALTACRARTATTRNAIQALGGMVPASQFGRRYWQKEHDAETPEWLLAKRLCEQTVLANYPNCLPINDIVQADQTKEAEVGAKVRFKNEEMFRQGYQYDYLRKSWLPMREMEFAGCLYADAYPNDLTKIGVATWRCPPGTVIPKGIPNPSFSHKKSEMPSNSVRCFSRRIDPVPNRRRDLAGRPVPDRHEPLLHARCNRADSGGHHRHFAP